MSIVEASEENISLAAGFLREGKLVGMPTETVYGIAANALDEPAVLKTFELKGRPSENPLIVHVASVDQAREITTSFPKEAEILAAKFWPGPFTMVLPKAPNVPSVVTGGLDTVAVRMPSHPVALSLIAAAGVPVSAPSANRFMSLSPTSAQMIEPLIANGLELILDGGSCQVGIESTVLDLTEDPPRVLRPGGIAQQQIETALGRTTVGIPGEERRSPGMYPKHYAPRTPVKIVDQLESGQGGLTFEEQNGPNQIVMSRDAQNYARELYQSLSDLDQMRVGTICVQAPPRSPEWDAVWDRLTKIVGS